MGERADALDADRSTRSRRRLWVFVLRPLLLVVVSLLVGRILVRLVGSVDWSLVATALGRLSWYQFPILMVLLLVRQSANAVPLSRFVPGLRWRRSLQNDLAANLIGTVAPPPGDVVIRVSMFKSWGISALDGMAGVTLNTLTFYVIRFGVPAAGVLLLTGEELAAGHLWLAIVSLVIAVAIVTTLILVSRGERLARLLGRTAGRVAARFRDTVDPQVWAESVSGFRGRMSTTMIRGLPISLAALFGMVLADGVIVLTSLRMIGLDSQAAPVLWVLGSFMLVYPLTMMPLAGLGVLDAVLVVLLAETAGAAAEPEIVAALVVWRVVTILGTLGLGALTLAWWRARHRDDVEDAGDAAQPASP